jgi:hypothetical protein
MINGGEKMISVIFYNSDLEVQFNNYEELKTYLEGQEGLVIKGITNLREEPPQ